MADSGPGVRVEDPVCESGGFRECMRVEDFGCDDGGSRE